MKYPPGRSAAAALISASVMARMFWGLSVDYPIALNAVWLCPLIGFALCLPLIFSIKQASKLASQGIWQNLTCHLPHMVQKMLNGLLALMLLYDAAVTVRLTASSSNIIALGDVTVHFLIVPLGFVACILVLLGSDAAGHSARIALRILPIFLLILFAVQVKHYHFAWLTPLLGSGAQSLISGGIYCAGNLALLSLVWLPALPDRNHHSLFPYLFFPCICVSLALACLHMGFPVMPDANFTHAARIELILSNGRMSLSPQFLLNILWYGGLLYLLAANVLGAAVYLRNVFSRLPLWILAIAEALLISIVAVFNPHWLQNSQMVTRLYFPIVGGILALCMILEFIRKRGRISCATA